jgi:hypothetical protein
MAAKSSFLAATNQRHGRTATRRFRHADFNIGHWDRVKTRDLLFVVQI